MTRYDATNSDCWVFTFKEGWLSSVAHDLKIRITRFQIDVDDDTDQIEATFDASSLRVECARRDGRDAPNELDDKDKRKIDDQIRKEALHSDRFPRIRFVSSHVEHRGDGVAIEGTLTLHGTSRSLSFRADRRDGRHVAEVKLNQPDFGIQPYRAAFGALRVHPEVVVHVSIPAT